MNDNSLKDSLLPNNSHVVILRQKQIDWEHFGKAFSFNEAQLEAIKSLRIEKGKYSEFFYMQDDNQAILKLIPEPLSYWIATTDAGDKIKIANLLKEDPKLSPLEVRKRLAFDTTEDKEDDV